MKNPLTPAGIEPATFRFVAQHLNHCATSVVWLHSLILRHRHTHTDARIHNVLIVYGYKSTFEYKRILFRSLHEIMSLILQVLPPKEQSRYETSIQRSIVTGIAYENLKENFINVVSGVTLVHQSPWGH